MLRLGRGRQSKREDQSRHQWIADFLSSRAATSFPELGSGRLRIRRIRMSRRLECDVHEYAARRGRDERRVILKMRALDDLPGRRSASPPESATDRPRLFPKDNPITAG